MPRSSAGQGGGKGNGTSNISFAISGLYPDTGISSSDGITNVSDGLVFSGTGDRNKIVYFYVDGIRIGLVSWAAEPNPDGSYDWSFTLDSDDFIAAGISAEGSHEITVGYETTSKGGKSTKTTFSNPFTLTIDQSTSGAFQSLNDDTGAFANDWLTQNNTPVVSGAAEIGASVTLYIEPVGGTPYQLGTTISSDGTWSFTLADSNGSILTDGNYVLRIVVEDAAGNQITLTQALSIDTSIAQPTVTGAVLTNDSTPGLSGTAEAGSTVEVFANNQSVGVATAGVAGTWELLIPRSRLGTAIIW
jgi:hypothetical protein